MPHGFHWLIAAQFASALADNALLIVTIALLQQQHLPAAWAPLLKFAFTIAYVLLAPWVGPLADAVPKARWMACMNAVKAVGAGLVLAGVPPLWGFALAGVGAAAFAPAKYGLITELVPPSRLVAANGWIEVSVVGAVLLGTVLGGVLVAPVWLDSPFVASMTPALGGTPLAVSLVAVLALYAVAALLNLPVPDSGARYPACRWHPVSLARAFAADVSTLARDAHGGAGSLAATTLFWGVGATLQFIVLRWATEVVGLPLSLAAGLQGVVAVGVVAGAVVAGRWVSLSRAPRMLAFGMPLGLALPWLAQLESLAAAVPLLIAAGAVGGLMVVPLNALLQHRGCALLSAGRSIAVQGFCENLGVLAMVGAYALGVAAELPLAPLMSGFGIAVALAVAVLLWRAARATPLRPSTREALPPARAADGDRWPGTAPTRNGR